jgi:hypothetical protein
MQRLLLVTGDLSVVAAIDASCGSVGLANGITSLLWVGPALLFMTAAGQVRWWTVGLAAVGLARVLQPARTM